MGGRRQLGRCRALLVAALAGVLLVLVPSSAWAAPGAGVAASTDRLLFATPMPGFLAARAAAAPGLDWSSDGCSVPLVREPQRSMPQGFDFRAACERHDFGYRNYRAQGRLTEPARHRLDDAFLADMDAVCAQQTGWFGVRAAYCRHIAGDYHFWVRSCGAQPAPYCPLEARDRFSEYVDR